MVPVSSKWSVPRRPRLQQNKVWRSTRRKSKYHSVRIRLANHGLQLIFLIVSFRQWEAEECSRPRRGRERQVLFSFCLRVTRWHLSSNSLSAALMRWLATIVLNCTLWLTNNIWVCIVHWSSVLICLERMVFGEIHKIVASTLMLPLWVLTYHQWFLKMAPKNVRVGRSTQL